MIDWIEMGRKTMNMLACGMWKDITKYYGLYREFEEMEE